MKAITMRSETAYDGFEMPKDDKYHVQWKQYEGQPKNQKEIERVGDRITSTH
jgi:hypothetical protein